MLNLEERFMIWEMRRKGLSISAIARQTGRDRKTIRKIIATGVQAPRRQRKKKTTKLSAYESYLQRRIGEGVLNTRKLLVELKARGYQGGLTQLIRYVQPYRTSRDERAVMRFETEPGEQAQVDWSHFGGLVCEGRQQRLYGFVMTLGYSRMTYLEFTTRTDITTWLRCHQHAFDYFSGVPRELLHDNLKTSVLSRGAGGKVQWNPRYLDFALSYGFAPYPCRPYRAQTKGKVERTIGYVKQNFWVGMTFVDLDDLNRQARVWIETVANVRLHGTTGEQPVKRMADECLQPLPGHPFDTSLVSHRRASRDCLVHYRGNAYSVPARHAQQMLLLKETEDGRLCVYTAQQELVAEHHLMSGRFQRSVIAAHYEGLPLAAPRLHRVGARQVSPYLRELAPEVEARPLSLYAQLLEPDHD